jgi:hypothetical protein
MLNMMKAVNNMLDLVLIARAFLGEGKGGICPPLHACKGFREALKSFYHVDY